MSLWKRITPEDDKKAEEEIQSTKKPKEPPIEFYPEEPKYSFDEIILPQSVKDKILDVANYADIESKYVGETPKNIRKAFEAAAATNSILFFDEADAILSKRVTNMSSATDVSVNQTRSVMLMVIFGQ